MDAPMDAADSARDLLRKRLMRSRMQQIEDSLARQQEIDTTPAPLLYEGYDVERQQARASTGWRRNSCSGHHEWGDRRRFQHYREWRRD
jgi:hypothetical protein